MTLSFRDVEKQSRHCAVCILWCGTTWVPKNLEGDEPDCELFRVVRQDHREESAEDGHHQDHQEEDTLEAEEGGAETAADVALAVHQYPHRLSLHTAVVITLLLFLTNRTVTR